MPNLPAGAVKAAAAQHVEYRGFTDPEPEDFAIAEDMLEAARPHLAAAGLEIHTEYATQMSGGGMHVRWDDPEMERIYPLAQWLPAQRRNGGHVYRRRVIIVEDWEEVTQP